jgi:hypothetical protein
LALFTRHKIFELFCATVSQLLRENHVDAPLIAIFVRHSAGCKYADDEFSKRWHQLID